MTGVPSRKNNKNKNKKEKKSEVVVIGDDDDSIYEIDNEDEKMVEKKTFIPGDEMDDDDELVFDRKAYELYHSFNFEIPCMSFDIITDININSDAYSKHKTVRLIAGSANVAENKNYINLCEVSKLEYKVRKQNQDDDQNEDSDDSESSSDDEYDNLPDLKLASFSHNGGVNRIKSADINNSRFVASSNEFGDVSIYDISNLMEEFPSIKKQKVYKNINPVFSTNMDNNEGYSLAWSPFVPGRIGAGNHKGQLYIWHLMQTNWTNYSVTNDAHTSSLEDIQWSPTEANVLATCGCDGFINIWDIRTINSNKVSVCKASNSDINVISWHSNDPYILSGNDDGVVALWDLRNLASNTPLISFDHHKNAVTSIEWHPNDLSTFICTGEDDQVTIWDLSVVETAELVDCIDERLPPQLMFIHMGQEEIKEVHWHPIYSGMAITTSIDGLNIFKTICV